MLLFLLPCFASPTPKVGVLGEMVLHPGLHAGVEGTIGTSPFVWGSRAGTYVHPGHHVGAFGLGEVGWRQTPGSVHLDLWLGAGLHHGWLPSRVVVREGDGLAERIDAGRPTALGALGLELGDPTGTVRPFGRLEGWLRGPVNHQARLELVLSLGVALGTVR